MIEVVYASKEKDHENDIVRLPKNIKQVGDMKNAKKIYIEDYAINYMKELQSGNSQNTIGILLGSTQKSGTDRYIFVKGVVVAPNVFASETEISFSDKDWNDIYSDMKRYFPGNDIVGWFVSTNNINAALFRTMRKVHMGAFPGLEKTLFLYDYEEKTGFFYMFENNQLMKQKGYTIYYERNEQMQEYMVDQREAQNPGQYDLERPESQTTALYRDKIQDKTHHKPEQKQNLVNYCANVAMVALILFIGVYILGDRMNFKNQEPETSEPMTLTNVIKVDGNVFPTTSVAEQAKETGYAVEQQSTQETATTSAAEPVLPVVQVSQTTEAASAGITQTTSSTEVTQVSATVTYREHTVKKGEKLITICKQYYGNTEKLEEIMEINGIKDVDKIYVGQIIKLP